MRGGHAHGFSSLSEYQLEGSSPLSGYVEEVESRNIRPSRHPLRDETNPLEELVASIMEMGLLEPIVVRPVDDVFEVVAGNRRFEACKRLKFRKVTCHVVELDDREAFEVSLTENVQRRSLNPVEEGQAFKKYVDDLGYGGISELAKRIGKSQSYVSRRIALLGLSDDLKESLVCRRITPSVANELLPLDGESRTELAEFITETKNVTKTEVRELARYMAGSRKRRGDTKIPETSYYEQLEMKAHLIDRTLAKCIASLKENMKRFDDAIESLEDKDNEAWMVTELLTWQRRTMNTQVDDIVRLRKVFRTLH